MESKQRRAQDSPVLPAGALPCVWMTAGLISYKLCDREYDCEHCPLDAAMQGVDQGSARSDERDVEANSEWEFRTDRRYHPCHIWAKAVDRTRIRCGLDIFAARLLSQVSAVVFPAIHTRLQQGRSACWLMDDAEFVPLCAPVSGTMLTGNPAVQMDPALVSSSPYDRGWLMEMEWSGRLEEQPGLSTAKELRKKTHTQLQQLHRRVSRDLSKNARVGVTLADGGAQLVDLRRILGTSRYHHVIFRFLG
jgi:glycine cleavage system H protein